MGRENSQPIFINEDLTSRRSKLFYQARMLRKRSKLFGVWSQNGNIMVKVGESSQPVAVQDYKMLKTLIQSPSQEYDSEIEFPINNEDTDEEGT